MMILGPDLTLVETFIVGPPFMVIARQEAVIVFLIIYQVVCYILKKERAGPYHRSFAHQRETPCACTS
jgi:hypothetical protein